MPAAATTAAAFATTLAGRSARVIGVVGNVGSVNVSVLWPVP